MKLLFRSVEQLKLGSRYSDFSGYLRVETDGETLYVTLGYQSSTAQFYSGAVKLTLKYNGYTRVINADPFGEKQSVTFPYTDNVKTVNLSGMYVFYENRQIDETSADGMDFTWRTSFESVQPAVTLTCPGPRNQMSHTISWSIKDPLGRPTAGVGLIEHYKNADVNYWTMSNVYTAKFTSASVSRYVSESQAVGSLYYVTLYMGVYESANDAREDYIELVEVESPFYVVSYQNRPRSPFDLQCDPPIVRAPSKLTWKYIEDGNYPATNGFVLERSLDGGDYTLIYAGTSTSFTDTIPLGAETVQYRVCAVGRATSSRSYYVTSELLKTILSNIYIGVNGEIRLASGLYIGKDGEVKQVTPLVEVG